MEFPNLGSFDPRAIQVLDYLKTISLDDIKDFIRQKKFELLGILIVLSALICVGFMYSIHTTSIKALETQQSALREKAEPIKKYKEVIKTQIAFLNSLPPALGENNFITVLTDIGTKRGVRITDFTPPVVQEDHYYKKLTSKFSFIAPEFRNVILFINDLEQSTYAIKIDSWALHLQQNKTPTGVLGKVDRDASRMFIMDLMLSSIKIETDSKVKQTKNEQ